MININHISDKELDMIETDSLLFEDKEMVPSATPKNIRILVDKINMLISFNIAIQEKNMRLEHQLRISKFKSGA